MSIESKILNENTVSSDELINEIAGEIENIDVLLSYIVVDFEKYIECAKSNASINDYNDTLQLVFTIENQIISIARKLNILDRRKLA